MPVACAPAPGGGTAPANAATSTATSRRMLVSLRRFGGQRETGTHPAGHRSRPKKRRGPPTAWTGRDRQPNQKRTPPVRMNVFPPPTSPRPSTNGVRLLRFILKVVPPSRFSPALVAPEPLTPETDP